MEEEGNSGRRDSWEVQVKAQYDSRGRTQGVFPLHSGQRVEADLFIHTSLPWGVKDCGSQPKTFSLLLEKHSFQ